VGPEQETTTPASGDTRSLEEGGGRRPSKRRAQSKFRGLCKSHMKRYRSTKDNLDSLREHEAPEDTTRLEMSGVYHSIGRSRLSDCRALNA
jgi:hypothetical protein